MQGRDGWHTGGRSGNARAVYTGILRGFCHAGIFGPPIAARDPPKEGIRGPADRDKLWVSALEGLAA